MTSEIEVLRADLALLQSERDCLLESVRTLQAGERLCRVYMARALGRPDAAGKWHLLMRAGRELRGELGQALERIRRSV